MKKEEIIEKYREIEKAIQADIISTKYGDRKVYRDEKGRFASYDSNKENGANYGARRVAFFAPRLLPKGNKTRRPYIARI